jgi:ABC-type sugar transport system substrate-binding protein
MEDFKMKMNKIFILPLMIAIIGVSGCAKKDTDTTGAAKGAPSSAAAPGKWKIGYNCLITSSYVLVTLGDNSKYVIKAFGGEPFVLDDEGSIEKMIQDFENMIMSGCDGILVWLPVEQLYTTVSDMCKEAKVPFVLTDKVPSDPAIVAEIKSNPYFAGAIGPANDVYGIAIAEYALSKGYKNCIIASSLVGDPTDDPKIKAFRSVFEAAGGVVLEETHSENTPAQGIIENALIAHPNPDFIYGTGPDYLNAASDALRNKGFKTVVMGSGLDKTSLDRLADPTSPVAMINGDYWISGMLSAIIMQNYLDGTPLKDSAGEPVWFENILPFEVPASQYGLYQKYFLDQFCFTDEEIRRFSGINNPEFDYNAFLQLIDDYSLVNRLKARHREGLITDEEMKAAGIDL